MIYQIYKFYNCRTFPKSDDLNQLRKFINLFNPFPATQAGLEISNFLTWALLVKFESQPILNFAIICSEWRKAIIGHITNRFLVLACPPKRLSKYVATYKKSFYFETGHAQTSSATCNVKN